jgi:hypothetical protein
LVWLPAESTAHWKVVWSTCKREDGIMHSRTFVSELICLESLREA